ncbi:hypothetical protein PR202_gb13501 [Eleusine coracana subsp. coracana]|uniref:RING-CH-type domain-containing protein n=1 Tax=Eleusine coracana subsp. coracana TaxID=191504 RepID=A0AAV5EST5_ELECO|nr:hypothetical protein PR202_gb13501 [Eleusine coracana subsp. coracana]
MAGDDHVAVDVDSLANAKGDGAAEKPSAAVSGPAVVAAAAPTAAVDLVEEGGGEDEPLIQAAECRICQEEDSVKNLEQPCACSGSLKEYKPGYTAPPRIQPDETAIDIRQVNFLIHMCDELIMNLRDPRILAVAAAQRRLLESDYDSYGGSDAGGAAFCRSAALILMALLLLRHALSISDNEGNDDDASTMFSLFLLRAAGFLLPCYIMAWIFSILHRRRQQQEEAALAAAEVAFILESARGRTLQFAIAPDSPATPQHATPQHEPSPQ